MKIIKIISEWKRRITKNPPKRGFKRVEAIVEEDGRVGTRHVDIPVKDNSIQDENTSTTN